MVNPTTAKFLSSRHTRLGLPLVVVLLGCNGTTPAVSSGNRRRAATRRRYARRRFAVP